MATSDQYYVSRCLDGHPDDFRHLVRRYHPVLMVHLVGQTGSAEQAEEALQETFVRGYFNLSKLKNPKSFFPWIMGISNRVALELRRKKHRQFQAMAHLAEQSMPPRSSHDHSLAHTIAKLPDFYRELILLRYYSDLSCKEIAEQLDMPIGTITKTLSRAYALLREMLRNQECVQDCEVQP
ncbi:MAG: sigma-70 family RNA polymerase sigma factor [Sedimentisphaerales bacterium]|nr:sigma-70 family RNA polymerase sigma factor [Sedimentisphaerales bacterium]